jgi:ferredoxin-NADP reductase
MSTAVRTGSLLSRVGRLAERVTTPLLPADYLDLFDPLRSGADLRGRIVAVEPETRDAVTVTIRPGRGWAGHVPGQYVRIGIDIDGVRRWRAYSVTSRTDRADGCLTIAVKAIADGVVSNHLVRRVKAGTLVQLDQATGEFVLPQTRPARTLFVTAGSGITPVMGMLRDAVDELADVVLLHSAPTAADVIFGVELRAMAAAGRLTLVERHTDLDGILDAAELADLVPDFAERQAWVCGPTGMLDALEAYWESHGVADRIATERFRATAAVTGDGGTVTFNRSATTVEADGATPILDAAEAAGVLMPSGCRMGICYGCVLPMREGAVRDLRTGEITTATRHESGRGGVPIQTCISAAAGVCDIDH